MKMAKASEKDIDAAGDLLSILDTIDKRFGGPWPTCEGPENIDEAIKGNDGVFDEEDIDHLRGLYNSLAKLLREAPGFHLRVICGMCYVVLFEENQIVDPADDCLALHPRFAQVKQQRDELLASAEYALEWMLQNGLEYKTSAVGHLRRVISSVKCGAA